MGLALLWDSLGRRVDRDSLTWQAVKHLAHRGNTGVRPFGISRMLTYQSKTEDNSGSRKAVSQTFQRSVVPDKAISLNQNAKPHELSQPKIRRYLTNKYRINLVICYSSDTNKRDALSDPRPSTILARFSATGLEIITVTLQRWQSKHV